MNRSPFLAIGVGTIAALLAGCGGGGSTSPSSVISAPQATSTPLLVPNTTTVNSLTTYSVFVTSSSGVPQIGIAPIGSGAPSSDPGWAAVTGGALVYYPDGSVQVSDVLGNFDASQSTWAQANAASLAANPNLQPEVWIAEPFVAPQLPLDTFVSAYAPQGSPTMTASSLRSAMGMRSASGATTASSDLASVNIFPRGVAMFDNERRTFSIVASDSDGQYVDLSKSTGVTWSVKGCTGGAGAGQVTVFSTDASKAHYTPPASGTFTCPDVVTASVASNGTTYTAAGNAFYYDISAGVAITGTLADATNKPVPNGIVAFIGGGREFYRGNLVAIADGSGKFSRILPPNRTMSPIGGNPTIANGHASAAFFTLNPSTVVAGAGGSSIAAATYTEGASFVNPFKALPPIDRGIRDAYYLTDVAQDQFPFNRPNAQGTFKTCSIDAIINVQAGSTNCNTVSAGDFFAGWSVLNIGGTFIFQQPAAQEGGRHVLQIASTTTATIPSGISDANTAALKCVAVTSPCFTFARFYNPLGFGTIRAPISEANPAASSSGAILALDGVFNEVIGSNGAFNVSMVRNDYSVGHQTPGSPLYTHTVGFSYANSGISAATINTIWYNAAALPAGTLNITRTPGTGNVLYTYASSAGTRTYYKGTQVSATIGYSLSGQINIDRTGTATATLTSTTGTDQTAVGTAVNFSFIDKNQTCPAGSPPPLNGNPRICGTVTNASFQNLTNPPTLATFTVDSGFFTTLALDPSLGSQPSAFRL